MVTAMCSLLRWVAIFNFSRKFNRFFLLLCTVIIMYFQLAYMTVIIIWLEARLQPNIEFTLRRILDVFTHLAITPLKVNQFG